MRRFNVAFSGLLLLAASAQPGAADQSISWAGLPLGDPCADYSACLEYRTLTEIEARSSLGYPSVADSQTASARPRSTDEESGSGSASR
jgi:hypothetical protein